MRLARDRTGPKQVQMRLGTWRFCAATARGSDAGRARKRLLQNPDAIRRASLSVSRERRA